MEEIKNFETWEVIKRKRWRPRKDRTEEKLLQALNAKEAPIPDWKHFNIKDIVKLKEDSVIEVLNVKDLDTVEKATKPKSRFKEATFIKELESTGIGRPSTFKTIVKTLLDESRGYCKLEDNYLVPTSKGIELSNFLADKFSNLININYTSEMESGLDDIAEGKVGETDFLESFYENLESSIKKVDKTSPQVSNEICPECGAPMVIRSGKFGNFFGCSKFPKCKGVKKIV